MVNRTIYCIEVRAYDGDGYESWGSYDETFYLDRVQLQAIVDEMNAEAEQTHRASGDRRKLAYQAAFELHEAETAALHAAGLPQRNAQPSEFRLRTFKPPYRVGDDYSLVEQRAAGLSDHEQ